MTGFIIVLSIAVITFFFFIVSEDRVSPVMRKILYEPMPMGVWETLETSYGDDEKMFDSAMRAVLRLGYIDDTVSRGLFTPGALYTKTKQTGRMSKLCATIMLFDLLRQKGKHCYIMIEQYNPVLYCSTYELVFRGTNHYSITSCIIPGAGFQNIIDGDTLLERITGY